MPTNMGGGKRVATGAIGIPNAGTGFSTGPLLFTPKYIHIGGYTRSNGYVLYAQPKNLPSGVTQFRAYGLTEPGSITVTFDANSVTVTGLPYLAYDGWDIYWTVTN